MVRVVVASAKTGGKAVKRPWLGARLKTVTPEIAETLGLKPPTGALVANVTPNSPAAKAGLKLSDLIVAIDGQAIEDPNAFDYRFATRPLGGTAQLEVQRNGKPVKLTVPLETAPDTGRDEIVITRVRHSRAPRSPTFRRRLPTNCGSTPVPKASSSPSWPIRHGGQRRFPEGRHYPRGQRPEDRQDQRSREGDARDPPALAHRRGARRPADQRHLGG